MWVNKTANYVYFEVVCVVCVGDDIITSARSVQQLYYSFPKTPKLYQLLAEMSRQPLSALPEN